MALPLSFAAAARGELVVFADGGFMSVASYEIDGEQVSLRLPSGGVMVVSLLRVARILADEIAPPSAPQQAVVPASFNLRFTPQQASAPPTPYGDLIFAAAQRHALNPALVAAVVRAESAFEVRAVSVKGARGLMQLMPATASRFGVELDEIFEPERNLDAGTRYLRWLADRFEDRLPLVLAAYNAGEGTIDRYGGVPPFRETRNYLRRIYSELGLVESEIEEASR